MDDYFDDYFEDFEQDVESGQASHKQSAKNITPKAYVKDVKRKPAKKPTMQGSSPKDRLLSSKDHELREMQNKLTATLRRLQEVDKENRTLRRLQIRQEKELSRISTQEGELPTILHKHNREVRALKHQLRESQLNNSELNKKRSEMSDELWRANERKKKLESLCKRKDLIEREHLMMELQDTNEKLRERQHRIQELEKAMELIHKTHSQEVKGLLTRQKQLQLSLTSANNDMLQFRQQLKEKERLLDVTNIYTQRVPPTSLPPPLPLMDDRGTQTALTRPPQEGEAVLITKRHTDTTSCQTDANWTTPKRVHTEGNPPPHSALTTILPAAKPAPVMTTGPTSGTLPFATNSTNTSIITTHSVPAGNQATPTPQSVMASPTTRLPHVSPTVVGVTMGTVATPTLPEEDEPIMKLNNQPMPRLTPPTLQSSQGQSYGTGQAKPTITSLATTTIVSQATPTIVSKATPKITANEAPKGSLGMKEKDDLLKKLFNSQYSSTSRNATPTKPIDNKTGLSFGGLSGRHDNNRERGMANESSRRPTNRESEVFGGDNSLITGLGVTRGRGLSEDIGGGATLLSSPLGSMFEQGGVASIVTNDDQKQHSSKRNKSKSDLISQLFDTPKTEAPLKEVGVALKRDEDEGSGHKGRGSVTSVLSQSERIRNMHQGLPSMASEDNRYGTRNGGRGKSGDTSGGVAGRTTIHGRRAGGEGGTTTNGGGLIFGDNSSSQRTPSIFADGNVTSDTNNLFSGRGTDRADNRVGGTYPWETQVELRPQQTSTNKFQVDDDLEELTIT